MFSESMSIWFLSSLRFLLFDIFHRSGDPEDGVEEVERRAALTPSPPPPGDGSFPSSSASSVSSDSDTFSSNNTSSINYSSSSRVSRCRLKVSDTPCKHKHTQMQYPVQTTGSQYRRMHKLIGGGDTSVTAAAAIAAQKQYTLTDTDQRPRSQYQCKLATIPAPLPSILYCQLCDGEWYTRSDKGPGLKSALQKHTYSKHKLDLTFAHTCRFCDYSPSPSAYCDFTDTNKHANKHHPKQVKEFLKHQEILFNTLLPTDKYRCDQCDKGFPNHNGLKNHITIHGPKRDDIKPHIDELVSQSKAKPRTTASTTPPRSSQVLASSSGNQNPCTSPDSFQTPPQSPSQSQIQAKHTPSPLPVINLASPPHSTQSDANTDAEIYRNNCFKERTLAIPYTPSF